MRAKTRFFVFLFIILAVAGIVCLLTLPMFHTKNIEVRYTDRKNEYIMKAIENLVKDKSVFLASRKQVKDEIEKDPYLVFKGLSYRLPGKLIVKVTEREPKFYVKHLNNYIYLTSDGYVINAQRDKLDSNLPEVKGFAINAFMVREKINIYDEYQLSELKNILEKFIPIGLEHRISEIDMSDVVNIKMKTIEGHEIIYGSSEEGERKIEWLYAILDVLSTDPNKKYIIDLSAPKNPTYKEIKTNESGDLQQ